MSVVSKTIFKNRRIQKTFLITQNVTTLHVWGMCGSQPFNPSINQSICLSEFHKKNNNNNNNNMSARKKLKTRKAPVVSTTLLDAIQKCRQKELSAQKRRREELFVPMPVPLPKPTKKQLIKQLLPYNRKGKRVRQIHTNLAKALPQLLKAMPPEFTSDKHQHEPFIRVFEGTYDPAEHPSWKSSAYFYLSTFARHFPDQFLGAMPPESLVAATQQASTIIQQKLTKKLALINHIKLALDFLSTLPSHHVTFDPWPSFPGERFPTKITNITTSDQKFKVSHQCMHWVTGQTILPIINNGGWIIGSGGQVYSTFVVSELFSSLKFWLSCAMVGKEAWRHLKRPMGHVNDLAHISNALTQFAMARGKRFSQGMKTCDGGLHTPHPPQY